jgi:hypothetical protein
MNIKNAIFLMLIGLLQTNMTFGHLDRLFQEANFTLTPATN